MRGRIAIDLSGTSFKTWVVVARDYDREEELRQAGRNKFAQYICQCSECGRTRTFNSAQIRQEIGALCECQGAGKRMYNDRNSRCGCLYCADKKKCSKDCKYTAIFEKYGSYAKYDAAAEKNLYAVVAAFPKNI